MVDFQVDRNWDVWAFIGQGEAPAATSRAGGYPEGHATKQHSERLAGHRTGAIG